MSQIPLPVPHGTLPGFQAPTVGLEQPFEMLHACHERVGRMLALLTRLQDHVKDHGVDADAARAAQDVMRYFDLAAPLHHQDEELHVFPPLLAGTNEALRAKVQALQADHLRMESTWAQARLPLSRLAAFVESGPSASVTALSVQDHAVLAGFAAQYGAHMQLEDLEIYPAACGLLSSHARQTMSADMMQRRGVKV